MNPFGDPLPVPFLGWHFVNGIRCHQIFDGLVHHLQEAFPDLLTGQDLAALGVDHLTLLVHDIVVFDQMLADVEVVGLDLLLGIFDGPGDHAVGDGFSLLDLEHVHDLEHPLGTEDAQQVVLQRQVELGRTGIALTAGTAAQLVVDAAGFMAFGAEDVQAAQRDHLIMFAAHSCLERFQHRLRTLHRWPRDSRLRHCFARASGLPPSRMSVPRPAMLVAMVTSPCGRPGRRSRPLSRAAWRSARCGESPALLEQFRADLGLFDGDGADQHRLPLRVELLDLLDDGVELFHLGLVDHIRKVGTQQRPVGGDDHHIQFVDLVELLGLGIGGTGHAGQLLVHAEIVLEGDRGQGLVLVLDRDPFLGLDGLVQAVGPAPARHETAGELVDDHDLAVLDHIVHVTLVHGMGPQGLLDMVQSLDVARVVEVVDLEQLLDLQDPLFGQGGLLAFSSMVKSPV